MSDNSLDALEARNEPAPKPELTPQQKTEILLLQRHSLTIQVTLKELCSKVEALQRELNDIPNRMSAVLTGYCKDLQIDPLEYTFDLDTLNLVKKEPTK